MQLSVDGLHRRIVQAAGRLFIDGHYAQAIFEAFKAVEQRVREMSGLDMSGKRLMMEAFRSDNPPIKISHYSGELGRNEQEGFRFMYAGAIIGIRNPKAHARIMQDDPQRALEYLGFASVLMRRLDDTTLQR
jgi:uncharacterized protein (TIGR02391 family)